MTTDTYEVEEIEDMGDKPVACGSCSWHGTAEEVKDIEGCALTPGDPSPVGRCPKCDALAYLDCNKDRVAYIAPELFFSLTAMTALAAKINAGEFINTDGSGCANVSAKATMEERQRFLEMAMAHVQKHIVRDDSTNYKMLCGALTWMDKDWDGVLGNHVTPGEIPAILAKFKNPGVTA